MKFEITSQDCELLLYFEQHENIRDLAQALNKDASVVSRHLKKIAERYEFLERVNNRWALSERGKKLNRWTKEAIYRQKLFQRLNPKINIASTKEFCARVLVPHLASLVDYQKIHLNLISSDYGLQEILLTGKVDFAFNCGRPVNPDIAFKRVAHEPFVAVCAHDYDLSSISSLEKELSSPPLQFARKEAILWDDSSATQTSMIFNDLASLRQAILMGLGWSVVPYYCVREEVKQNKIKILMKDPMPPEKFGVWWLRERTSLKPWVERACKWLGSSEIAKSLSYR